MIETTGIDELSRRFGIAGVAEVVAGNGGLAKIRVTSPLAAAEIHLYGAQVTSWRPAGEREAIFLSDHSQWQDGRPIRGGIPICFPCSQQGRRPEGSFARVRSHPGMGAEFDHSGQGGDRFSDVHDGER